MLKLYIGSIPTKATTQDIRSYFSKFGHVLHVLIKGAYGFIEFKHKEEGLKALYQTHGKPFFGATLRVEIAKGRTRGDQQSPPTPPSSYRRSSTSTTDSNQRKNSDIQIRSSSERLPSLEFPDDWRNQPSSPPPMFHFPRDSFNCFGERERERRRCSMNDLQFDKRQTSKRVPTERHHPYRQNRLNDSPPLPLESNELRYYQMNTERKSHMLQRERRHGTRFQMNRRELFRDN